MHMELLKVVVSAAIYDVPVGHCWKMIHLGTQGKVKPEDQMKALHVYMDEANLTMAKPLLTAIYPSKPGETHTFPMEIQMRLLLEINLVMNQKGWKNVEKLQACQNSWTMSKLVFIKTWEIKLLDSEDDMIQMTLHQAMMTICHPTSNKFALFQSIDKSHF